MRKGRLSTWLCGIAVLVLAAPAQAAFPGAAGPLAYSRVTLDESVGSAGGLFAHGPRKRDRRVQLTDDTRDSSPSYSPNGRLIVFSGNRDGARAPGSHIYVMRRDGSDVRQLTGGELVDSNPSFSPDGRLVVFDRSEFANRTSHIFSVPLSGGEARQLTRGSNDDSDPVYAPNGRWIAFVSDRRRRARTDRSNIFSMRPNGSRVRLLIGGVRNEFDPDISPDGGKIVFASNRHRGPNLFVAHSDGKRVRALTRSRGDCFRGTCYTNPSWAPDGKHIAFLASGRYKSEIEVMRSDGRGRTVEFEGGGTEAEGFGTYVGPPSWGPRPR
ncbi:MAG TPA: hypothetical protein VH703_05175 [Solirubrobacterales bacterium]|jgi:Tol biopolymer transport system component